VSLIEQLLRASDLLTSRLFDNFFETRRFSVVLDRVRSAPHGLPKATDDKYLLCGVCLCLLTR
jgi:hypothetical protein